MRRTLGQLKTEFGGAFEEAIGGCGNDDSKLAAYANRAQQQLIFSASETGFWGGWAKVVFNVLRCDPYITLPPIFARVINMAACNRGMRIQNEFYEFLEDGIGLQPGTPCQNWCGAFQGFERGVWPSMLTMTTTNQYLTVFVTDPADVGKRIVFQGAKDQNGNGIYTQDGTNSIIGTYLDFVQPFAQTQFQVSSFDGIWKDQTVGDILLYQTDATTGAQVLLSRYGPNETNPAYRRYFINQLPCGCAPCPPLNPCLNTLTPPAPVFVQVTALCKYEYQPALRLTDPLIIGNIPALIEEAQSIRYSKMDAPESVTMAAQHHAMAIRHLNKELGHYLGVLNPAVNIAPFGTARLGRRLSPVRFG